ncbi:hypothetical protein BH11PSE11_BH11PSE11_22410 [soil metagenome]
MLGIAPSVGCPGAFARWRHQILLLATVFMLGSLALPAKAADFAKNFNGFVAGTTIVIGSAVDGSGNTYITGYFSVASVAIGGVTLTRYGASSNSFAAKLDASGTVVWAKNFGGAGAGSNTQALAIAADSAGNVYLSGFFQNDITTPALTKIGSQDSYVIKLDTNGNTIWAKNIGGSGAIVYATEVAVDGSGNVYLGGFRLGSLTTPVVNAIGIQDGFIIKLDANGNTTWANNIGGSGAKGAVEGIAVDGAGNVHLAGTLETADWTMPAVARIGTKDVVAVKLDSSGNTLWATNFGGAGASAQASSVALDGAGNVHVAGFFIGANLTTPALTKIGSSDALVVKLNSSGTMTWAKNFGGASAGVQANGIAVDSSNNIYLGGRFGTASLTSPVLTKIGSQDGFAFKLDSSGNITWASNFGGSGATVTVSGIAFDGAGNVYPAGQFSVADLSTPALTKVGSIDAVVLKLDSSGSTTWSRNYGGGNTATAVTQIYATANDTAGNTYFAGTSTTSSLSIGGVVLTKIGTQDGVIGKLDASGATVWAKRIGGTSTATVEARAIAVDASGNVYLGGYFSTVNLTTPALTRIGTNDAFAIKFDSSGNTTWAKNFGGAGANARAQAIAVDGSGNVYVGGYLLTANLTTPVLAKIGASDAFAIKLDSSGNTTWGKNFGGAGATARGLGIAVDGSFNVYLGGYVQGADLTTPALSRYGVQDALVIKLDSSGSTTWAKNFGGAGATAQSSGLAVDGSGNIYLGGQLQTANLTTPALTLIGTQDAYAIKLDSTGSTTWAKNFGGAGAAAQALGLAVDASGNVYLGGVMATASLTTPSLTRIGTQDAYAVKLDSTGSTTWAKKFGGDGAVAIANAITVDSGGNAYLGGTLQTANLTSAGLTLLGNTDGVIIRQSTVLGAPVIGTATGGASGTMQATVTFTAPALNGGFPVTGYTVTSNPAGGVDSNAGTTGLSHVITGLTNGTAYTFTVIAANVYGPSAASAASNSVTLSIISGAPVIGVASGGNAQATVTFTAPASNGGAPITGYTVTSNPAGGVDTNAGSTSLSHVITGLNNGTAYTFTVTATNINGTSAASAASNSVTPSTLSGAPVIGAATAGNAQATVTFTAPASNGGAVITGYTVSSNPAGGVDSNAGSTGLSHVITGLTNGVAYTFTVTASNANGAGPASGISNSVTPSTVPGAPVIGVATPGNAQATVSFAPPVSNGGSVLTGYTVTSNPAGGVDSNAGSTSLSHLVTGLTNGTAYTFTVRASNVNGAGIASAASNSVTPSSGNTYTAPSPTGGGLISAVLSGGGATCSYTTAAFIPLSGGVGSPPAGSSPAGVQFPLGLFDFTTGGCTPGGTITLTVTYPQALAPGSEYWKYGPTPPGNNCSGAACATPHWYVMPATIAGNTAVFTITDGGLGDDDLTANGSIVDQGGPGFVSISIPTLSEWAMILLAGMVGMLGMLGTLQVRRRRAQRLA